MEVEVNGRIFSRVFDVELTQGLVRVNVGDIGTTFDEYANRFGARLLDGGEPVDTSSMTVTGYFLRPNRDTVPIQGRTQTGMVYVDLSPTCYSYDGEFTLVVKVLNGESIGTVLIVDGRIPPSRSDSYIADEESFPSIEKIEQMINELEASVDAVLTLNDRVVTLESGIATANSNITKAQNTANDATTKANTANSGVSALDGRVTTLESGLSAANNSIADVDAKADVNATSIANVDAKADENADAIADVEQKVEANATAIAAVDDKVDENADAIAAVEAKADANATAIAAVDDKANDNAETIAFVEGKANTNATNISSVITRIVSAESSISNIQNNVRDANQRITSVGAKADDNAEAIAEVEAKANANTSSIASVGAKVDENTSSIADVEEKADENAEAIAAVDAKADENAEAIAVVEAKANANTSSIASVDAKAKTNTNNIAALTTRVTNAEKSINNANDSISTANQRITAVETKANTNASDISGLKTTSENHNARIADLDNELEMVKTTAEEAMQTAESGAANTEALRESMQTNFANVQTSMDALDEKIEDNASEIFNLGANALMKEGHEPGLWFSADANGKVTQVPAPVSEVTAEEITDALGYTPADAETVQTSITDLDRDKLDRAGYPPNKFLMTSEEGEVVPVESPELDINLVNGPYGSLRQVYAAEETDQYTLGSHAAAFGHATKAAGEYAFAEGFASDASGYAAHAENGSTAEGRWSHSEGRGTHAIGENSHAEGHSTYADGENQHVQGKNNIRDNENKYAHIVGNGDANNRSNAHTLDWDGNAWFAGNVYVGEGTAEKNRLVTKSELEAASVNGGGGGGSAVQVQPDYGENDPESPAYIKNRTHWAKSNEEVLFPETTFEDVPSNTRMQYEELASFIPTLGEQYNVYWNGTLYELTAEKYSESHNIIVLNKNPSEEIPFALMWDLDMNMGYIKSYSETTATVKITQGQGETVHKLDPKYLPEGGVGWTEEGGEVTVFDASFSEEEYNTQEGGLYIVSPLGAPIEAGKTYTVIWQGVEYPCVGQLVDQGEGVPVFSVIGNFGAMTGEGDTGEPFLIMGAPADFQAMGIYAVVMATGEVTKFPLTVKVTTSEEVIHKIDPKYLPEQTTAGEGKQVVITIEGSLDGTNTITPDCDFAEIADLSCNELEKAITVQVENETLCVYGMIKHETAGSKRIQFMFCPYQDSLIEGLSTYKMIWGKDDSLSADVLILGKYKQPAQGYGSNWFWGNNSAGQWYGYNVSQVKSKLGMSDTNITLKSPDGTSYKIAVDNNGNLTATKQ